jgi:hypothetical protein
VSLRRSEDLADALATRGPWMPPTPGKYSWRDGLLLICVGLVGAAAALLG